MEHNAILDSKLSLSSNIPLYAQLVASSSGRSPPAR